MENYYELEATSIKYAWVHQFFRKFPYVRKMMMLTAAIFMPWLIIYKYYRALDKMRKTKSILYNELEILKNDVVAFQPKEAKSAVMIDEVAGLLNWPEILIESERENGFLGLIRLFNLYFQQKNDITSASNCWILLAAKNCDQLLSSGYYNFKRTIAHNYFNFLVQEGDSQIQAIESQFSAEVLASCRAKALAIPHDVTFKVADQFSYKYFVLLLWEYAKKIDKHHYLDQLEEPQEGNPILVHDNKKGMSQDLANSLIEYYSIDSYASFGKINTVLEIGGGYGRNAHVILTLNPKAKVVLVDIFPALYVAQRYLSSVFKNRKIFKARQFDSYQQVEREMEEASIVFLLPHQLEMLPDKKFDLCMNISSFGEMNVDQIKWYFDQINRLAKKYFFSKQWKISKNPFDNLELKQNDYPIHANWKEIYSQECAIQTEFFETLYQVN